MALLCRASGSVAAVFAPILENVDNTGHDVVKEIAHRNFSFNEHRCKLEILSGKQSQLTVNLIRGLGLLQILPIGKTECGDFGGINLVRFRFANVLRTEFFHAQSIHYTDENIGFKQLSYHG